jgi:glycosyltransferase involved in cell wall biosynthesis
VAADLHVLALLPYPVGRVGGQRYRIEQWAPRLEAEGISISYSPFLDPSDLDVFWKQGRVGAKTRAVLKGYARRLRDLQTYEDFDVVFVYREAALLGTGWFERLVARRCPIVFDFDDAIYLPATSDVNKSFAFLKRTSKVPALCRMASAVTVGNGHLASFAQQHNPVVEVVPSTIDTDEYQVPPPPSNRRPVVGWTGSPTTVRYLLALGPALRRLRQVCDFELLVIGASAAIEGVDVRVVPWQAETEVADLRVVDVGLMPLPDDEWTKGKCGLKALQYMGLGIPPVVSPVGTNLQIVEDGINGFHARSDEDWVDRIAILLRDPALRRRLGTAARTRVEHCYSARVHAPRLAALLRRVHDAVRSRPHA